MARFDGIQERDGHSKSGHLTVVQRVASLPGTEVDTGFDFKKGDIVKHVYVRIYTAEATGTTKTIDVGILSSESGGDADGFLDGVVTSATGTVTATASATDGSNQNFWATAPKRGALLYSGRLGTDAAGDAGAIIPIDWVCDGTAVSLTHTVGSAGTELDADIVIEFFRPHQS